MTIEPAGRFREFDKSDIEQSIPGRFARQVELYGDRIAVSTAAEEVTYRELDARANRLAQAILGRRGKRQEPAGLLFEQGPGLIAATLGVLKAGGIYVPLNPRYPRSRLSAIIEHSGPGLILADRENLHTANELMGAGDVLCLEEIPAGTPIDAPDTLPGRDDLAYTYYTSGTTGQPKGVADSHRNVLHNIMRYTNALLIGADDRLTLLQSASFSGAVSSLFSALLNGATVYPFDVQREAPDELSRWVRRNRLTMWHSVPALFRQLVMSGGSFPDLRVIRLEGDLALPADIELYRRHFSSRCVLAIGLGTTETGLVRQFLVDHDTDLPGGVVPAGYPVQDTSVSLLDEDGSPVGPGGTGEIAVTSRYLAAGYWKDPSLTAARFRPHPGDPEVRTYLTGDLGRMRPDGCLDFLGRKAFDLKIAGQRVELAEVEAALTALPGVRNAAAAGMERSQGDKRLVAYLVAEDGARLEARWLREQLAERLPLPWIPSKFLILESLPLNENGKVDRRLLPDPGTARPATATLFAAPQTVAERCLAQIWREELGIDQPGIDDDFFELGGDSLDMMRILSRSGLEARAFLDRPTIRRLAALADARILATLSAGPAGEPEL